MERVCGINGTVSGGVDGSGVGKLFSVGIVSCVGVSVLEVSDDEVYGVVFCWDVVVVSVVCGASCLRAMKMA